MSEINNLFENLNINELESEPEPEPKPKPPPPPLPLPKDILYHCNIYNKCVPCNGDCKSNCHKNDKCWWGSLTDGDQTCSRWGNVCQI